MSDSGVSVLTDANAPAFGDGEDALIGVQNNSTGPVSSITLQGAGLFVFDGDGLCDTPPTPNGCPFGPTHYEGPGISFNSADGNTGTVSFTPALAPGASAYFTLEGTPDVISAPPVITSLTPASASSGQAAFTLTLKGANFGVGATVLWTSPSNQPTTLIPISVSTTQIAVNVTAALVANAETAQVAVSVGPQTSASVSFPILGLRIITTQLPAGVLGSPYPSATLQAANGTPPYLWGWGAGTPPGLSLDTNTGAISGIPTATGTYPFPINVTDASNKIVTGALTIVVTPPPGTFGPTNTTTNPTGSFAEPVNTATGNYYSVQTDLSLRVRGLNFVFNRYYNSFDSYNGSLGFGWSHSYNISLTVDSGTGIVTVKEAAGGTLTFNPSVGGYTAATPGCYDTLVNTGSGFILIRKNRTKIAFSSSGALTSVTDRNGNQQTMTRSGAGDLTSITYVTGRSVTLAYDSSHRITSITDPSGRAIHYSYDLNGNLASVTDAAGGITRYSYDSAHRMTAAVDPRSITYLQNTFDATGRVTAQVNGVGATTRFAYNTPAARVTTITDANGNTLQHIYDGALRLVQTIDGTGGKTTFAYDANNNRTSITDANGHVTTLTWDAAGNATSIKDAAGNTTQVTYDINSNPTQITDPAGHTTVLTYDLQNNNLETTQDAAGTTIYAYDSFGQPIGIRDAAGNSTQFTWDSVGDLTQVIDGAGRIRSMIYDNVGRLTSSADQLQRTTKYQYDNLDRLVVLTDPLGLRTVFNWDAMHDITGITDANGQSTAYTYDGVHNLVRVTDALGQQTQFAFDGNNNRITYTNARGKNRSYTFDAANRLIRITDPLGRQTSKTFDAAGNAVSVTDGNKATNVFTYDALNRLVGIRYPDGSSVSQSFDSDGNRVSITDRRGTTAYVYDAVNRLTRITRFDGVSISYAYDPIGRRTAITYPDGRSLLYQYDGASNVTQVTDWNNQITSYSYDQANKLVSVTMPGPLTSEFGYDVANRLTAVTTFTGTIPGQSVLSSFGYSLDNVGNRLQVSFSGPTAPFNQDLHSTTKYAYDALYRLTSVTNATGQTVQYDYDAVGNRIKVTSPAQSLFYTYDDADEMLTGGGNAYSYDGNGSMISKLTPAGATAYSWDSARRLVSVSGNGGSVQYDYDGDGNRLSQQVSAGTYSYITDPARVPSAVISEQGPDGPISYQYGRSLIGLSSASGTQYTGIDGIGSIVNVVNSSGALKGNYAYDAWGTLQTPADPLGTKEKYKWAGEAFDSATGLYYLRARYYDPTTGRFLSQDRVEGAPASPWDRNRYVYARNNPLGFRDPYGLSAEPIFPAWDPTAENSACLHVGSTPICGGGVNVGGTAYSNVGNFAVIGGAGVGNFVDSYGQKSSGAFVQGGAFAGNSSVVTPDEAGNVNAVSGTGVSFGLSTFLTNAHDVSDLSGKFDTYIFTTGIFEFQYARSGDIWVISGGIGLGAGEAHLTTNTPCTSAPNGCEPGLQ